MDLWIPDDFLLLQGSEQVCHTNREQVVLGEIHFRLFPNTAGALATISALAVNGQETGFSYELENSGLRLDLPAPLQPGEEALIELDFQIEVPREMGGNFGLFGYFDDVLTLDGFYPVIPVYDDEGWNVDPLPSNGDATYLDAGFYLVRVTAPESLQLVASGIEIDRQRQAGSQSRTFAAGPARDFYLAAGENYALLSERAGETRVNSYASPEQIEQAGLALQVAVDALEIFNESFGPYPYSEFDIVSIPMQVADGIEYPGLVGLSSRLYDPEAISFDQSSQGRLESAVAHEAAHQWFYNVVGNDQIDEPWLDEALAQYATGLYYANLYGQDAADSYRQAAWDDVWGRAGRAAIPIGLPSTAYAGDEYSPIIYGRGPLFIAALAEEMGQETFDEFIRDYYQSHQWEITTGQAFKQLAELHCHCDLNDLFREWVWD